MSRLLLVVGLVCAAVSCAASDVELPAKRRLNDEASLTDPDFNHTNVKFLDQNVASKAKELIQLCYTTVDHLMQYCELQEANCEWIFIVLIAGNANFFKHREEADKINAALLGGRIPVGIKPLIPSSRQATINNLCSFLTEDHVLHALSFDFYSLRPYTTKGVLRVAALNTIIRPYSYVPADMVPAVRQCATHYRGLVRHFKRNQVAYDELLKNVLGLDPRFSAEKWCTILLNVAERTIETARRKMKRERPGTRPVYEFDIMALTDPKGFNELVDSVSTHHLREALMKADLVFE